ncbi:MAG: protein kinase, partial [Cytophagales bacterium]|nr:protein kinase [Cytophagales bacterium]
EGAIPVNTRWLILTNNRLTQLPVSIGKCYRLQKCMLAGNQLSHLPDEMSNCTHLELLRISANMFSSFPDWLFRLPKLSWLALGGNPGIDPPRSMSPLKEIEWADLEIVEPLGSGASGIISKALWKTRSQSEWVAVKEFKGEVTSDGLPKDEMMACIQAGFHPHLVNVLGKVVNHSQGKDALVLGLIPPNYSNLAGPPSFESCTRDVFPEGFTCSPEFLVKICRGIASASKHLHDRGVSHGDLYAHNILIDELGNPLFGDFGAATIDEGSKYPLLQNMEVRAFGCLMEDLIKNVDTSTDSTGIVMELQEIMEDCLQEDVERRPSFGEIVAALNSIS